jgi:hypothetical protein
MSDQPNRRIERALVSSNVDSQLAPKRVRRFVELLQGAVKGEVPVFFAQIPLPLCVPFDLDYLPDSNPATASGIRQFADQIRKHQTPRICVYPRGRWFVVADDYLPFFAAIEKRLQSVPCWILSAVDNPLVEKLQGPISPKAFRSEVLGWR